MQVLTLEFLCGDAVVAFFLRRGEDPRRLPSPFDCLLRADSSQTREKVWVCGCVGVCVRLYKIRVLSGDFILGGKHG